MKTLLEHSRSGPRLILDAGDYAQAVLLQGKAIPWQDATAYANHLGQMVALLKPQATVMGIDKMIKQALSDNTELVAAMGEKSRSGFALKTFMGDESFKAAVGNVVATTTKMLRVPIIVQLPSPLDMLSLTAAAAHPGSEQVFDDDDAENAAVYFADWLRAFTDADIAGLMFDERVTVVAEQAYQPIKNTADHYQWCVGVRRETEVVFSHPHVTIAVLPSHCWITGEVEAGNATVFSEIPKEAIPEKVLESVAHFNT